MKSSKDAHKEKMIHLNLKQKSFYESRFDARGQVNKKEANQITNLWTYIRRKQQKFRHAFNIQNSTLDLHKSWVESIDQGTLNILDLGCFSGNALSFWLAEKAKYYLGVDLSEKAINELRTKIKELNLNQADAVAMDFLDNDFEAGSFDLVYAYSVLHHFQFFETVLKEIHRILKPGGHVISFDPLNTSILIRLARAFYKPFQSDYEWEFPFKNKTFKIIEQYFQLVEVRGSMGIAKYAFPISLLPACGGIGAKLTNWGNQVDHDNATKPGFHLNQCLQVSLLLNKTNESAAFRKFLTDR